MELLALSLHGKKLLLLKWEKAGWCSLRSLLLGHYRAQWTLRWFHTFFSTLHSFIPFTWRSFLNAYVLESGVLLSTGDQIKAACLYEVSPLTVQHAQAALKRWLKNELGCKPQPSTRKVSHLADCRSVADIAPICPTVVGFYGCDVTAFLS